MGAWIALSMLIVAGLALVLRHDAGTVAGFDATDFAAITASLALLIYLGFPLLRRYSGRYAAAVRDLAIWAGFALVLVALYSFRQELAIVADRVAGELLPPGTQLNVSDIVEGERAVRIRKRSDGHFIARAQINNTDIMMIVDTGASTVVLRQEDARRLGIDLSALRYSVPVQTANGTSYAAHVRLPTISIGPVGVRQVEALIAKPGALHQSLLGMSFLSRLRSYEFSGNFLTLRS